ncbi:MAG: DNA polymerase I [Deltaproteobacteria bacterium]|nr:DNA polymerase I [Deltaproteobacteria bacterium]MBW2069763.1 DNA polymerase I [Deltaproteobacteria bacterium]
MANSPRTLYLIDGSSYIYRAFYAIPSLSTSHDLPTNAAYGFLGMLRRVLTVTQPEYMAVALDAPGPTFRHELSPAYKANRPQMPEALASQLPFIRRIITAYGIAALEVPGYEADDIIATITTWAAGQGTEVVIVSGDKDLLQLVSANIQVWDTMKDRRLGPAEVEELFGVPPSRVVEIMALAGDSTDNIPGVPGIGPKTARRLIKEFGSIESLLANLDKIPSAKQRARLETYADQARLSRQLVVLDSQVPLPKDWSQFKVARKDNDALAAIFRELEFHKFLRELEGNLHEPAAVAAGTSYTCVSTESELTELSSRLGHQRQIAVVASARGRSPLSARVRGLAVSWQPRTGCYIPLTGSPADRRSRMPLEVFRKSLAPVLTDEKILKVSPDSKTTWLLLHTMGIDCQGLHFDPLLAAYLLDPGKGRYSLRTIASKYLNVSLPSAKESHRPGQKAPGSVSASPAIVQAAAAEAEASLRLREVLHRKLELEQLAQLFYDVEMPLTGVLARMELRGVRLATEQLQRLSQELSEKLALSEERIFSMAGEVFNVNSSQQLAAILFDKLGLPTRKKTKTGYSTDMGVLSSLAHLHPLPAEVITYRSLLKLKNTYVDSLPRLIHPATGRIHTSYNQMVTATGRLSSSNPNLQNIPVRTQEGRAIRRAFVAAEGSCLLAADYSQIELRILAHLSDDEALKQAFLSEQDIHRQTAAELFSVEPQAVTESMRRRAKTINFGIIYGMSPYGLAKELHITQAEARDLIDLYFQRHKGVGRYLEKVTEEARQQGFVTTLFGRKRYLPDLQSRNRNVRRFAERTAVNTPIQGTAADIIKIAMIRIDRELRFRRLPATMIMQVHDELVFEVVAEVLTEVTALVREQMESVVALSVPLRVKTNYGDNWDQAH